MARAVAEVARSMARAMAGVGRDGGRVHRDRDDQRPVDPRWRGQGVEQDIEWWLRIDPASRTPPYEQIKQAILDAVRSGEAAVGTRLPPVRALAAHLGIAANTVARAYRELEQSGAVETKGRAGTIITAGADDSRRRVAAAADDFAAVVRSTGLPEHDAVAIIRAALRRA